jgi:hypothetical protein
VDEKTPEEEAPPRGASERPPAPAARRRPLKERARQALHQAAIPVLSGLIAGVLLAQIAASLLLFPVAHHLRKTWPFLDYPMYSRPHYEGDRVSKVMVLGIREDGSEVPVTAAALGLGEWHFHIFVKAVLSERRQVVEGLLDRYEKHEKVKLQGLRVVDRGQLFTRQGLEPAPERILGAFTRDPPSEE